MKKKIILLIAVLLGLTGCGKLTKDDALKKLEKKILVNSYTLKGTMEIISNEEKFDYSIMVNSLDQKYYKVGLVNQTNNHEQVILKNEEGVYVITPSLNKSFKFQSEWPNNGSQAYILESILKDLKQDKDIVFEENENGYTFKSKVNYPNNTDFLYQKVLCNKNMEINRIDVYDNNDNIKITVRINEINYKAKLKNEDFNLDDIVKNNNYSNSSCGNSETLNDNNCLEKQTSNNLDDIIYPLYVPENTYLSSSEKIDTENGDRVILTFNGEKDFVIVEEISKVANEFEIIPIYGDPEVTATSVAAVGANSIYLLNNNIEYYIASEKMNSEEMLNIVSSLNSSISVVESK